MFAVLVSTNQLPILHLTRYNYKPVCTLLEDLWNDLNPDIIYTIVSDSIVPTTRKVQNYTRNKYTFNQHILICTFPTVLIDVPLQYKGIIL